MIHTLKKLVLLLVLCVSAQMASAQVAYVEAQSLIDEMPIYKRALSEIESYEKQLQRQLKAQEEAILKLYQETLKKSQAGDMSPNQEKAAQEKLQKMQQKLQTSLQQAEQDLAKKRQSLLEPVYKRFNSTLESVAKQNSYEYILDKGLMIHVSGGINATTKVRAALGL